MTTSHHSKHRIVKSTSESAKNVINITKTIAERQQMRAASVYYHGMFNFTMYTLPQVVMKKSDLIEETAFNYKLRSFMGNSDLLCSNIVVNNQQYKNGDLIVLDVTNADNLKVGLLQTILIKNNKVYFVVQNYDTTRTFLQYFESKECSDPIISFTESNKIADYKPLIKRGTSKKFIFVLHHHISYDYQ